MFMEKRLLRSNKIKFLTLIFLHYAEINPYKFHRILFLYNRWQKLKLLVYLIQLIL
jgi:hypothetical protein